MTYLEELYNTPNILSRVLSERIAPIGADRIVFTGCGTSYYIGGQVANLCRKKYLHAIAVDAVNILDGNFLAKKDDKIVFISRSGNSKETVLAMEKLKRTGADLFYLGCTEKSVLDRNCENSFIIPYAAEENILESYSYYAQLLLACMCCGITVDSGLPKIIENVFCSAESYYHSYIENRRINRIISLGCPFYMPQLREMMLKDGEITQLPAESWGILEFRHGPRSWADEYSLIEILPGDITAEWDKKVAAELSSYGCNVRMYSKESVEGVQSYHFGLEKYSVEETIAVSAFHVCVAGLIGKELGTSPEKLPHVVNNVGEL